MSADNMPRIRDNIQARAPSKRIGDRQITAGITLRREHCKARFEAPKCLAGLDPTDLGNVRA
jgi:hypothetical protein